MGTTSTSNQTYLRTSKTCLTLDHHMAQGNPGSRKTENGKITRWCFYCCFADVFCWASCDLYSFPFHWKTWTFGKKHPIIYVWQNLWYTTHTIHGTIVYLPRFSYIDTITINQMLVNIPYMDAMVHNKYSSFVRHGKKRNYSFHEILVVKWWDPCDSWFMKIILI